MLVRRGVLVGFTGITLHMGHKNLSGTAKPSACFSDQERDTVALQLVVLTEYL